MEILKTEDLTTRITEKSLFAAHCFIVGKDGLIISHVKEYDYITKEAVVYKFDENNRVVKTPKNPENPHLFPRFEGDVCGFDLVLENVILEGSQLMFRK